MNKKIILSVILALLAGFTLWGLIRKGSKLSEDANKLEHRAQPETMTSTNTGEPSQLAPTAHSSSSPMNEWSPSFSNTMVRYVQNVRADPQYDWKQPINFYGKVLDESNQPIENASVDFTWTDLSPNGTSHYHTWSDSVGLFSMLHKNGKRLSVSASKSGYYSAADARLASFEYANPGDGLFTPDPTRPVVFHLRKKGAGVNLITSQFGMASDFQLHVQRDGTPTKVDLMERKIAESGQLLVSQIKPEYKVWKQATSWSFKMEITDGGFIEENDEFPFEAPEGGYRPVAEFYFNKAETNWTVGVTKKYYIKFGSPARYGYLQLNTSISMGGAIITYAINPAGSRNLEPQ